MKLAEYAAQNPQEVPETPTPGITIKERQDEVTRAHELMQSITRQMEQGNTPQAILITAIECIGLLTRDREWSAARIQQTEETYKDLAQISLLTNNDAIAAERLQQRQTEYIDKLQKNLTRQLKQCQSIERGLKAALTATQEE